MTTKGVYMPQSIAEAKNKILTILVFPILLGSFAFAEHNITHDDAYLMAREAYDKGHKDESIGHLLMAERLGNNDAYNDLCWLCDNDKDNNLTKEWCSQNHCRIQK